MKKEALLFMLLLATIVMISASSCKKDENGNPVISAVVVNPATVNANGIVSIAVTATDPDNDALTYAYTVTGGAISGSGPSVNWTAPATAGAHSVTVVVTDGNGGQATGNGALTVLPAITQITGTAKFPAGTSGDLSNAKVSIYTSYENWVYNQPIKFGSVTGAGASVAFTLSDVNPGNYYLDVWKDIDNDGNWSVGDYVGWYGSGGLGSPSLTEFQIAQGETKNFSINMYIIAKKSGTRGSKI
ncbi:MAG TPA: hypothetical protein PK796_06590 [Bacteroidales bacterium]|nr:hypothetical protein [Bacteroidales bacterium]